MVGVLPKIKAIIVAYNSLGNRSKEFFRMVEYDCACFLWLGIWKESCKTFEEKEEVKEVVCERT